MRMYMIPSAFFILLLLSTRCLTSIWFVKNTGEDIKDCGAKSLPCRTLEYILPKADDGDHVKIISAKNMEKYDICLTNDVMYINNSITISGADHMPLLICRANRFAFKVTSKDRQSKIKVAFTNIAFAGEYDLTISQCSAGSYGIFDVTDADVVIDSCEFQNICTSIKADYSLKTPLYMLVKRVHVTQTNYFLYSENIVNGNITVLSTIIRGKNDVKDRSHALNLVSSARLNVVVKDVAIDNVHEGIAIKVLKQASLNMKITKSIFSNNQGQSVLITFGRYVNAQSSSIYLADNQFVKNHGVFASSIHIFASLRQSGTIVCRLKKNIFLDNKSDTFFGAIYVDGVTMYIENSDFANNVVGEHHGSVQGFGGALYIEDFTTVIVNNTNFINNTCSGFGGTVFSRGQFSCSNCSFIGPSNVLARPLLGDILYATAGLDLINTTWIARVNPGASSKAFIWHPGSPTTEKWSINIAGKFTADCPEGHNISYFGIERDQYLTTQRIAMTCKSCPTNEYSLSSGKIKIIQNDGKVYEMKKKIVQCHHCKFGGTCNLGSIRPQANYYGYRTGVLEDEVRFMSCPIGYCCNGKNCEHFNSCNTNRTGLICGKCKNGTSENLINSDCIDEKECNDHWFWPLYFFLGTLYILFFMYLDKISKFVKDQLIWWDKKIYNHDDLHEYQILKKEIEDASEPPTSVDSLESSPLVNEQKIEQNQSPSTATQSDEFIEENDNETVPDTVAQTHQSVFNQTNKEPDIFTDIMNISFYFFQMFLLIRMQESIIMDSVVLCFRSFFTSFFTLSIQTHTKFTVCPIKDLNAVTKLIFVRSMGFYVLMLLFFFHVIIYITQFLLLQNFRRKQALILVSVRLKVATIQIILVAYATLSTSALTLLNCVPVNSKYVLFIDGTIDCYRWWQFLIFLFVICWIIPFPMVMVYSIVHLKNEVISYHKFILAWMFPVWYLFWTMCMHAFWREQLNPNDKHQNRFLSETSVQDEEKISIREILYRLEGPYKGIVTHNSHDLSIEKDNKHINYIRQPAFWQGTLIGRRLILILAFTFISSPVFRLYFALLLCTLYLVHHLYFRPYLIKAANIYETVTSVVLIIFCSTNLFFAYSYVSDLPPEAADENLGTIFRWFEATVIIIIPSIALLILFILVLTRVGSLLVKVIKYLFCCKNEI